MLLEICCYSYAVIAMLLELHCVSYAVRAMLLELCCQIYDFKAMLLAGSKTRSLWDDSFNHRLNSLFFKCRSFRVLMKALFPSSLMSVILS